MIGPENCSKRMNFVNLKSRFGFLNNVFLKYMFFILSLFSIVKNFIFVLTENVSDDKAINFKDYDWNNYDTDFKNQYAFICGILWRKYSYKTLKNILNFLKCKENEPRIYKNTEVHDDTVVARVKFNDFWLGNGSFVFDHKLDFLYQILQDHIGQSE